jgi:hypothetical protein
LSCGTKPDTEAHLKFYLVWTISDDEDFPSGRGATMIEALQQAKAAEEHI